MANLEIEAKFRVDSHQPIREKLLHIGAMELVTESHADHYFNAPDRDFAQTDEAFRIRRIDDSNYLTYKGPKRVAATKTRPEIEVEFESGQMPAEQLIQLLQFLGYRPVAVVRKERTVFLIPDPNRKIHVCLDSVPEVGSFVEVEIIAAETEFDAAQSRLLNCCESLGLTVQEKRSYLTLLLGKSS